MALSYDENRTNAILTRAIKARGTDPRKVKRWVNRMGAALRFHPVAPRTWFYTSKDRAQFLRTALLIVGKLPRR